MVLNGIYFGTKELYNVIREQGGVWNDTKERPIVCLIKSAENDRLYWAIPIGNLNHRNADARNRLNRYMAYPEDDIRSCYYHIGHTTTDSIFFISDVIPITDKYIDREYLLRYSNSQYIIKNNILLAELKRKLTRILAWERSNPNSFRQHITDVKHFMIKELNESQE